MKISLVRKVVKVYIKGEPHYFPLNTRYGKEPMTQFPIGGARPFFCKSTKSMGVRKPYVSRH